MVYLAIFFLKIAAWFSPKLKLFVRGRKDTYNILSRKIKKSDRVLWVHTASLGEFEQGLPLIEALKNQFPEHKIVLTFFSPSGYEVKKDTPVADAVTYLPMDTRAHAKRFIAQIRPELALFIKYEIWPNYLKELKKCQIPTILAAAIFNPRQIFFKPYGGFMRQCLKQFDSIFVQDQNSVALLHSINIQQVRISGDTRFDRVAQILERDNQLDFMEAFTQGKTCFVGGSTWPPDEALLLEYIQQHPNEYRYVIAPHNIHEDHIQNLIGRLGNHALRYSKYRDQDLSNYQVLVVDTVGLLTKIYSYATIAYVGGGFGTGLHNTLEPAVFGIPVIIGPEFSGFKEAEELVALGGVLPAATAKDFGDLMADFNSNPKKVETIGTLNRDYVQTHQGATHTIMESLIPLIER